MTQSCTCSPEERAFLDLLARRGSLDGAVEAAKQGTLEPKTDQHGRPLPSLFICTPQHDRNVHSAWFSGCLAAQRAFRGRVAFDLAPGSILPRNRDMLTDRFLDSGASHMLCIDSDIGWHPAQAQALLDTGKPFVSGTYCKKQSDRDIPAKYTGRREGSAFATLFANPAQRGEPIERPLWEATHVPAGFLLLERQVIERMIGAYRELEYHIKGTGTIWALWYPLFEQGVTYSGEDVAFCSRWRKIGGEIWMHRGVVLDHYGEHKWIPREDDLEPIVEGLAEAERSAERAIADAISRMSPEQQRAALVKAGLMTETGEFVKTSEAKPQNGSSGARIEMRGNLPVHIHPD